MSFSKNCLGALDATHIRLRPVLRKPKYQNRKDEITKNVLRVCTRDMQFIYMSVGWEDPTADSRVKKQYDIV